MTTNLRCRRSALCRIGRDGGDIVHGPPTGVGVTTYAYDQAGQRTSMTDNYGGTGSVTDSYSYDANGNLLSGSNDNAQTTTYAYDAANDVTCVSYPTLMGSSCSGTPSGWYVTRALPARVNSIPPPTGSATRLRTPTTTRSQRSRPSPTRRRRVSPSGTPTTPMATSLGSRHSGTPIPGLSGSVSYTPNANNQVGQANSSSSGSLSSPSDTYNTYGRLQQATNPNLSGTGSQSGPDVYAYNNNGEIHTDTPPGGSAITDSYKAPTSSDDHQPEQPHGDAGQLLRFHRRRQRCLW